MPLQKALASSLHSPPTPKLPPPVVGAMGAAGAVLDAATATLAMVVAVAQVVVVVSIPGAPVQVLVLAALGTPPAFVAATTKDVMSSSEARVTLLGPSALRLESYFAPNTPPMVIFAAIPAFL